MPIPVVSQNASQNLLILRFQNLRLNHLPVGFEVASGRSATDRIFGEYVEKSRCEECSLRGLGIWDSGILHKISFEMEAPGLANFWNRDSSINNSSHGTENECSNRMYHSRKGRMGQAMVGLGKSRNRRPGELAKSDIERIYTNR